MKRIIDVKIWKTGNSYVVTIPKNIIERYKLKVGKKLEITLKECD